MQTHLTVGKATAAQYADLAERYAPEEVLEPGTVVCFGGDKEVVACEEENPLCSRSCSTT